MKIILFLAILVFTGCTGRSNKACNGSCQDLKTLSFVLPSQYVPDSFDIKISFIGSLYPGQKFSTIYYLDANLKSGKKLLDMLSERKDTLWKNTLFIGIGHKGDYRELRRRDFIPPVLKGKDTLKSPELNFGHADNFYKFLSKELIPFIEKQYPVNEHRTLIGHSFGGLFVFYSLFKHDRLFKYYIALSPSLWVNYYNVFSYEEQFSLQNPSLDNYLYLSAGTWERLNYVLTGNRRMKSLLEKRNYTSFCIKRCNEKL